MEGHHWEGIVIILVVIAIAAFGGVKNMPRGGANLTLEQKINQAKGQVEDLKIKIQDEEDAKNSSVYKGSVTLRYVNRSTNPDQEYITIQVDSGAKTNVPLTGWTIKSLSSGNSYTIPKGTRLFFSGSVNSEEDVVLAPGDLVYITTGLSPIGYSFKVNECSGYLEQFQNFTPYISAMCPRPRDENLSSIPQTPINDECLDYIDSLSRCNIQTEPLPITFTAECRAFINDKINYGSCINVHKNDPDFYKPEWRIYLKRNGSLWKQSREHIVLYDTNGKLVDSLTY